MYAPFPDIESLAADPQFIAWVRSGRTLHQEEWANWETRFPEQAAWLEEAAELVDMLSFSPPVPTAETIDLEWAKFSAGRKTAVERSLPRRVLWSGIAAVSLLILAALAGILLYSNTTYQTDYAEQQTIKLDDGTLVILEANSSLEISRWEETIREVKLEGGAFFNVAHQPERPFTVLAGQASVEVLGTRFNLENRAGQQIVALEEGKVTLTVSTPTKKQETTLVPGEVAAYNTNSREFSQHRPKNLRVYTSWKEGYWELERTPLKTIADRISTTFGLEVVFENPLLAERELSGRLPADDTNTLVRALGNLLDRPVIISGNQVLFQ